MKYTYENLKGVAQILKDKEEEELIDMYKDGKRKSEIVAKIYCDNVGYLVNRANKYKTIDEESKASYALQSVYRGLENYDRRNKLISLIGLYFEQELKDEIKMQVRKKRNRNVDSTERLLEQMESENFICSKIIDKYNGLKNFNYNRIKKNLKNTDHLTKMQKEIIIFLLEKGGDLDNLYEDFDLPEEEIKKNLEDLKKFDIYKLI